MRNIRRRRARQQPTLRLRIDVHGARPGERASAADIVKQDFRQAPIAERAPTLRNRLFGVANRAPGQAQRTIRIGQEFRIVKALRGARQLQLKPHRRKRDDLIPGFVVIEVVVIVLQKKYRRRAKVRAIDIHNLRPRGEFQHGLIVIAKHQCRSLEALQFRVVPALRRKIRRMQVPVDVIAIRNHGLRLK